MPRYKETAARETEPIGHVSETGEAKAARENRLKQDVSEASSGRENPPRRARSSWPPNRERDMATTSNQETLGMHAPEGPPKVQEKGCGEVRHNNREVNGEPTPKEGQK